MTRRAPSLTWRLFAGIGLPVVAIIALIGGLGYVAATREINEVYDSQLAISAQSLLRVAEDEGPDAAASTPRATGVDDDEADGIDEYAHWHSFRVWRDGKIVLASPNAPTGPTGAPGYATQTAGDTWRVFTLVHGRYIVETRENVLARGEEIAQIVAGLSLPLILLLPVIAAVLWVGIRIGLRGLRGFAEAVARRSSDDMSPIDAAVPVELVPVVDAVNGLMEKLATSLDQERAFTDNAAHELRTPLAVIKAQAEVVAGARTQAERATAMTELGLGVNRGVRLLEQLLTLARLRHVPPHRETVGLMDQGREAIKDVYPAMARKRIDVRLTGDEAATVLGDPALVHLILRNVLENAVKYAPEGTAVDIDVAPATVVVRDRGPGIAEAERDKVFARFYRAEGTREAGSGLGLSIVRTAAQRLRCEVGLFTPNDDGGVGQGLGVRIVFS